MHTTEMPRRLLLASEVLQMVEDGILSEDEQVELIEGELLVVSPQGPPHASRVGSLQDALARAYAGRGVVRVQMPLTAEPHSLPEPDLCVVRGSHDDYGTRHPDANDVFLVVECSRTSHALDRQKIGVYARAGVTTYWIVDLVARHIEVHSAPGPLGAYRSKSTLEPGELIALPGLDRSIAVSEVLGQPVSL
jgi:Uma2 family endonuclease